MKNEKFEPAIEVSYGECVEKNGGCKEGNPKCNISKVCFLSHGQPLMGSLSDSITYSSFFRFFSDIKKDPQK